MKKAKSFKFIILTVAFCISMLFGVLCFNSNVNGVAHATYKTETEKYFETDANIEYKSDALVVTANDGDKLSIVNPLVINDFGVNLTVPTGAKTITLELTSNSFVLHGNKNTDGKFDTKITNKIVIDVASKKAKLNEESENDITITDGDLTINVVVSNNVIKAVVNGVELLQTNEYYMISGNDYSTAYVSLGFNLEDGQTDKEFKINYIDQATSDGSEKHKQTFTLVEEDVVPALPVAVIGNEVYTSNGKITVKDGEEVEVSIKCYSVYDSVKAEDLYIKAKNTNDKIEDFILNVEKPRTFMFNKDDNCVDDVEKIAVTTDGTNELSVFDVVVLDEEYNTTVAPEYSASNEAIEAFKNALEKATKIGDYYISLGKTLEIPSMKDLVKYDYIPFEELKYTVYVNTPTTENSTTNNMNIRVDVPGEYKFFVMFRDGENSMESPIDNENIMLGKDTATQKFVFSFKIEDNAPLVVEANKETVGTNGYVGVRYSAVPFNIDAESFTPTYTLWYNADSNADLDTKDGWVKVLKKSEVTSSYKEEVFTTEDINTINYDGKLNFTPVKEGAYRIDCEVSSGLTVSAAKDSYLIKVTEVKKEVKPESQWLKNNMVSVIFLGVGTLCLIGIVVLLFVKPKEKTDSED
jgi:hypothetical protein